MVVRWDPCAVSGVGLAWSCCIAPRTVYPDDRRAAPAARSRSEPASTSTVEHDIVELPSHGGYTRGRTVDGYKTLFVFELNINAFLRTLESFNVGRPLTS